jgi:membrane protease YdiL (CAAX protease family)
MSLLLEDNWILLRIANIGALIIVAGACYFWTSAAKTSDQFFDRIPWNVWSASASLVLIYTGSILIFIVQKFLSNWTGKFLFGLGTEALEIIVLLFFFRFFGQGPAILGLSKQSAVPLIFTGLKWILCIEVGFHLFLSFLPERFLLRQFEGSAPFKEATKLYGIYIGVALLMASYLRLISASIIEEITFRGLLYSALRKRISHHSAIALSAVLFMLVHGFFDPISFVLGCVLAYMYEKYRSILPGMLAHALWNILTVTYTWTGLALNVEPISYHRFVALFGVVGLIVIHLVSSFWRKRIV